MFNPYEIMKPKMKKGMDETIHFFNLYNTAVSMFEWKNLPDTIRPELLEGILLTEGTAPIGKLKGEYYTGTGGYCGNVYNFIPEEYQFVNVGVGNFRGKVGKDCTVCWNNATMTPDFSLMQFASILTEVDVSERINLLFTRFLRIPKVKDNKEKKAVEDSIRAIIEGRIEAVVSKNIYDLKEILGDAPKDEEKFLDLVDIKEVDKLQYLNQYRDNVVKRFFQTHGMGMQSTAKLAQQTTDELHGSDTVSMILPENSLAFRKRFAEQTNELFGLNLEVDFSKCFKDSEEQMEQLTTNGMPEPGKDGDDNAQEDKTEEDT